MNKVLTKIKGWFYREKKLPGGIVYKRCLFFCNIEAAPPPSPYDNNKLIQELSTRKRKAKWIPIPKIRKRIQQECNIGIEAEIAKLKREEEETKKRQQKVQQAAEAKRLEEAAKEKLRLTREADIKAWGNNIVEFHPEDRHKFELIIKGENNVIKLGKLGNFASSKCKLHVYGNHNELTLGNNVRGRDLYIRIGEPYPTPKPTHHGKIRIGNNLSVVSTCIHLLHSHSSIIIGDNCMFSFGIQIRNTDGHPIYEKGSRIPINHVQDLIIGDHVWIGHSVSMTKSAQIAHDCVVGCNSVICKKYEEPYCAIAGNPAKIVRRNIEWESNQTADFLENGQNIDSE